MKWYSMRYFLPNSFDRLADKFAGAPVSLILLFNTSDFVKKYICILLMEFSYTCI